MYASVCEHTAVLFSTKKLTKIDSIMGYIRSNYENVQKKIELPIMLRKKADLVMLKLEIQTSKTLERATYKILNESSNSCIWVI